MHKLLNIFSNPSPKGILACLASILLVTILMVYINFFWAIVSFDIKEYLPQINTSYEELSLNKNSPGITKANRPQNIKDIDTSIKFAKQPYIEIPELQYQFNILDAKSKTVSLKNELDTNMMDQVDSILDQELITLTNISIYPSILSVTEFYIENISLTQCSHVEYLLPKLAKQLSFLSNAENTAISKARFHIDKITFCDKYQIGLELENVVIHNHDISFNIVFNHKSFGTAYLNYNKPNNLYNIKIYNNQEQLVSKISFKDIYDIKLLIHKSIFFDSSELYSENDMIEGHVSYNNNVFDFMIHTNNKEAQDSEKSKNIKTVNTDNKTNSNNIDSVYFNLMINMNNDVPHLYLTSYGSNVHIDNFTNMTQSINIRNYFLSYIIRKYHYSINIDLEDLHENQKLAFTDLEIKMFKDYYHNKNLLDKAYLSINTINQFFAKGQLKTNEYRTKFSGNIELIIDQVNDLKNLKFYGAFQDILHAFEKEESRRNRITVKTNIVLSPKILRFDMIDARTYSNKISGNMLFDLSDIGSFSIIDINASYMDGTKLYEHFVPNIESENFNFDHLIDMIRNTSSMYRTKARIDYFVFEDNVITNFFLNSAYKENALEIDRLALDYKGLPQNMSLKFYTDRLIPTLHFSWKSHRVNLGNLNDKNSLDQVNKILYSLYNLGVESNIVISIDEVNMLLLPNNRETNFDLQQLLLKLKLSEGMFAINTLNFNSNKEKYHFGGYMSYFAEYPEFNLVYVMENIEFGRLLTHIIPNNIESGEFNIRGDINFILHDNMNEIMKSAEIQNLKFSGKNVIMRHLNTVYMTKKLQNVQYVYDIEDYIKKSFDQNARSFFNSLSGVLVINKGVLSVRNAIAQTPFMYTGIKIKYALSEGNYVITNVFRFLPDKTYNKPVDIIRTISHQDFNTQYEVNDSKIIEYIKSR